MSSSPSPPVEQEGVATVRGPDRRRSLWRALWIGAANGRRRRPRRDFDETMVVTDWHHPQWLGVTMLILLLSIADAVMTITLMNLGAIEINPLMRPFVTGSGWSFAFTKLGLTSVGVVVLVLMARVRAFGTRPVGLMLYFVLACYAFLVTYESWLLLRDYTVF